MRQHSADAILFLIVIVLGSTFLIVKDILVEVGPLYFLFFRFFLALIIIFPWTVRCRKKIQLADMKAGALLGAALTAGFTCQTIGLQTTLAGKAAFITGLNVVLVPVLARIWFQEQISLRVAAGVGCAFTGLALLCLDTSLAIQSGDIWILFCAVAFAVHVAGVTRYSSAADTHSLNLIQISVTTIIAGILAVSFEEPPILPTPLVIFQIIFMATVATALILFLQIVAQRHTSATRAALLFSLEPVFAALFAWALLGEMMNQQQSVGAGLMLVGVILAELRYAPNTKKSPYYRPRPALSLFSRKRNDL